MQPAYFYDPITKILVKPIPKCGYQSIQSCLNKADEKIIDNFIKINGTIISFIRDPVDRLISGFQFFFYLGTGRKAHTYEEYVDRALIKEDEHWSPQHRWLEKGIFPTDIYRFEELNSKWKELGLPSLQHKNASIPIKVNKNYRIDDIYEYYKGDYQWR